MNTFSVIDVETANASRASICQIGLVLVVDGKVKKGWDSLVDPECYFDPFNVSVHGIKKKHVRKSPTFGEVFNLFRREMKSSVLVSHSGFDRVAINNSIHRYNLEELEIEWLDSMKVVRSAYPDIYGKRGYGLKNVAKDFDIQFNHHDAFEDALATAKIMIAICLDTGVDVNEWLKKCKTPISRPRPTPRPKFNLDKRKINFQGPLHGESVVFTGSLSVTRKEVADFAAKAGCNVMESVTNRTTVLVVGIQDERKFSGYDKSSKHRKVEGLIGKGKEIRIISEEDFWSCVAI